MKRKLFFTLILIIFGTTPRLEALVQISVSGSWSETIDSSDLISGPEITLPSTYTSSSDAVSIDIDAGRRERWLVYVSKNDAIWDPRMQLYVKRTSGGSGSGRVRRGKTFQEITPLNQTFVKGRGALTNISIQFQLTGISLQISPAPYSTTVTYTITDI